MRLQRLEPQRSVGRIMLGFPIVWHVAWAICLDSVARPAGRLPNAGNVVARSRARFLPGLQRVDYGPPPAVEQRLAARLSRLLFLRCPLSITRSSLGAHKHRKA